MSTNIPMDRAGTLLECLCLLKIRCSWNDEQIALCLSYSFPDIPIGAENIEQLFREALRHRHTWLQKMRQEFQDDETSEITDFATDVLEGHNAGRGILTRTERISREDARKIFPLMQHQSGIFPEWYPRGFNVVDYLMSVIRGHPYSLKWQELAEQEWGQAAANAVKLGDALLRKAGVGRDLVDSWSYKIE